MLSSILRHVACCLLLLESTSASLSFSELVLQNQQKKDAMMDAQVKLVDSAEKAKPTSTYRYLTNKTQREYLCWLEYTKAHSSPSARMR